MTNPDSLDQMRSKVGQELGVSDWVLMDQRRFDLFAQATDDPDPMHIDSEWCETNSPFGSTIAFGFLTISMLTELHHQVVRRGRGLTAAAGGYGLNYGFDRLRLIAPIPVNSRIRGRFTLISVEERKPDEILWKTGVRIEIEGSEKLAMIGEWLILLVRSRGHERIAGR